MMRPHSIDRVLLVLLVAFAILNLGDLISTFAGLNAGMREGNPLMNTLLQHYGFWALIVYKLLVVAAVTIGVFLLRSFHAKIAHLTIWVCNCLVFGVVMLNIAQFLLG